MAYSIQQQVSSSPILSCSQHHPISGGGNWQYPHDHCNFRGPQSPLTHVLLPGRSLLSGSVLHFRDCDKVHLQLFLQSDDIPLRECNVQCFAFAVSGSAKLSMLTAMSYVRYVASALHCAAKSSWMSAHASTESWVHGMQGGQEASRPPSPSESSPSLDCFFFRHSFCFAPAVSYCCLCCCWHLRDAAQSLSPDADKNKIGNYVCVLTVVDVEVVERLLHQL
ncbi:hypothetical protein J0S82_003016 [Galemys pyrenaicus]|uniref:Uncharacterized protein n=1 Tax=Galemys pyrenaicus TaxID=202257 RepID=A0A8J6B9K1_GALPY|nr:hypothetical protein J0S82_003016 [Galemys pyrenaicus]